MKLVGGNAVPVPTGVNQLAGTSNYLIGKDPTKWHRGITSYEKVQYSEVYSGIDLMYYGNQHQLEYDFTVKPGADPKKISFTLDGPNGMLLDNTGGIAIQTEASGTAKMRKPVIYQIENGQQRIVDGGYKVNGHIVSFDVKNYNTSEPLVIDPVLDYSTYLGGSGDEWANGLAVDSAGHAFVTGYTDSADFPVTGTSLSSAPDGTTVAFVSELNADGTDLVFSTYLGGTGGDGGSQIAVDTSGYVYVGGATSSTDFPVTSSAFQSALPLARRQAVSSPS